MGFIKDLWKKFRATWLINCFALVGFFAILAEIWPLLMLVSPYLAIFVVLFYNNVVTFFGGFLLLFATPAFIVYSRFVKRKTRG